MKKLVSLLTVFSVGLCTLLPTAHAEETYNPVLYMRASGDEENTSKITIDKQNFGNQDYKFTVNVYINDESLTCWNVAPKCKCADKDFIKLENLIDPTDPLIPYAYAETDSEGNIVNKKYSVYATVDSENNTVNFTVQYQSFFSSDPLKPYGEFSDSYPVTSFDVSISKDIPIGEYEIYFLTQSEDYSDQQYSKVYMRNSEGSTVSVPFTENLILNVVDGEKQVSLGDINNDGSKDSSDASLALEDYAKTSTGEQSEFDELQKIAGDVNQDGIIDSTDASSILSYYAYRSVTADKTPMTIQRFLRNQ